MLVIVVILGAAWQGEAGGIMAVLRRGCGGAGRSYVGEALGIGPCLCGVFEALRPGRFPGWVGVATFL